MILGKKGKSAEPLWVDVSFLVACAVIFVLFMGGVSRLGKDSSFEVKFFSRDFALLIDSIFLLQGNIIIDYPDYPNHIPNFDYKLDTDHIEIVSETGGKLKILDKIRTGVFNFVPDKDIFIEETELSKPRNIRLAKLGNKFFFQEKKDLPLSIYSLNCPNADVSESFNAEDIQYISNFEESMIDKSKKYIVALKQNSLGGSYAIAYIPSIQDIGFDGFMRRKKLACETLNSIAAQIKDIGGLSIVPYLDKKFQNQEMIIIEIDSDIKYDEKILLGALDSGVKKYFKKSDNDGY